MKLKKIAHGTYVITAKNGAILFYGGDIIAVKLSIGYIPGYWILMNTTNKIKSAIKRFVGKRRIRGGETHNGLLEMARLIFA